VAPSLCNTTKHVLYHSHRRQGLQLCRTWFSVVNLIGWTSEHPLRICLSCQALAWEGKVALFESRSRLCWPKVMSFAFLTICKGWGQSGKYILSINSLNATLHNLLILIVSQINMIDSITYKKWQQWSAGTLSRKEESCHDLFFQQIHFSCERTCVCQSLLCWGTWLSSAAASNVVVLAQYLILGSVQLSILQLTVDNLV